MNNKHVMNVNMYLSVRLENLWYGVCVDRIMEVVHLMAFAESPAWRDDILGFITVRDQVIPLIDMGKSLKSSASELRLDTPIVIIREADGLLALIFDEINQVEIIDLAKVTTYENTRHFHYVTGVTRLAERLLLLLDTEALACEIYQGSSPVAADTAQ